MRNYIFTATYIAMFLITFVGMISLFYHGLKMWKEMTPTARTWANWVPIIVPFLYSSYNDVGKKHLGKFFISFWVVMFSFAATFAIAEFLGESNNPDFKLSDEQSNKSLKSGTPQRGAP